jgi:methylisocitrate lyase
MIEDQVAPKRCGHTKGTSVVSRAEAVARVKAACDARDEGQDQDLSWRRWVMILLGFNTGWWFGTCFIFPYNYWE